MNKHQHGSIDLGTVEYQELKQVFHMNPTDGKSGLTITIAAVHVHLGKPALAEIHVAWSSRPAPAPKAVGWHERGRVSY